ncbi:formylglycine-generating enzyme family protein [Umezawaea tangerina]|uniref:Formylglycine-generating enzyme required for sulfatase activity n=1 Tax=Umezawaea tangerina TaxID=84725 RepID=A0A2T0SZQ9_9PSEU|nr:SUMF1/EgtB/PvdO family nonheme iron enzyme [Umezawaea tangerina]PRY38905.1 formylglycine-generating enzyme required for sulfatase activity [Umezawaea tangerina]
MTIEDQAVLVDPHDADDRVAMGLPHRLVTRVPADSAGHLAELVPLPADELVGIVESESVETSRRYFAGQLLALLGDPRIRPDDPAMVDIPGGATAIGLPEEEVDAVLRRWGPYGVQRDWIVKECPRHEVEVAPFRMMRFPVTNLEYHRFLSDTGHWPVPTSWQFGAYPHERANHPVWTVSETGAEAFADWSSRRLGRALRLPTEAEWEYAACGGDDRAYPWGAEFRPDAANTVEAGPLTTTPVGMYPMGRSPFGLDDLAGNVEEIVADSYAPYPGGVAVADDLTSGDPQYRVARGGSFTRFGDLARCRRRHGWYRDRYMYAVGFRLVEDI